MEKNSNKHKECSMEKKPKEIYTAKDLKNTITKKDPKKEEVEILSFAIAHKMLYGGYRKGKSWEFLSPNNS